MKIGIVCYPTFGGSGVVATELGKALASKGHEIHFITYSRPFRLDHHAVNLHYHEVAVSDYPLFEYSPYELVLSSKLVDVVKYEGLDLLHVHYAIPHASAAYMAKQILKSQGIEIPFITTLHGTDITLVGKDASFEPVITFAINESDAVTAVSESLKQDTIKHFGVKREILVIPNFVCFDCYRRPESKRLKDIYAPNNEKLLVHVSNFRKVKRVPDVLQIFDKVNKETPSRLILVGDGPEKPNIERLCRELGLGDKVSFVGKINDPEQMLSTCDIFLLTSKTESFGMAALEAMAAGLPVIGSNQGGLPEVVIDGETGYLSDVGNVDEMASNAISLLSDNELYSKFSTAASERAKSYDISEVLPLYEELYNQVAN